MKLIFDSLEELKLFVGGMAPLKIEEGKAGEERTVQNSVPPVPGAVPTVTPAVKAVPAVAAVSTPAASVAAAPSPAVVPVAAISYTPDDLARAAMTLMDAGRQTELIGLLQQFGVTTLPDLKQEQYGAFATALRGMGAKI